MAFASKNGPRGDREVIAEFRVVDPAFPLSETLASSSDLDVRTCFQPWGQTDRAIAHFVFRRCDVEVVEAHLEADGSVQEYECLRSMNDRRSYRVRLHSDVRRLAPALLERGLAVDRLQSADGGWAYRVFAPDRETLLAAIEEAQDRCTSFSLTQLHADEDASGTGDLGLTPAQRETLTVAYREGFFEVPRGISQAELGEHLDVSTSAVSQRIRKGLEVVLAATLEAESM